MNPTLPSAHDPYLVALSVAIAITASYVALDLAGRVIAAEGRRRLLWLFGGAVGMGTGIWSMHFIAMLAFSLPIPVFYHVPTVLFSLLAAITASFVALVVVSAPNLPSSRLVAGGVLMGLGIVAMHYSGMDAMRMEADTHYDRLLWTLSAVIAAAVSLVGLTLVFRFGKQAGAWSWQKVVCAVVMGAAIPLMHYTGMAAASFTPTDVVPDLSFTVSVSRLGGAAIIFGTFLLLGVTFTLPGRPGRPTHIWLPALRVLAVALTLGMGGFGLQYVQEGMVKEAGASLAIAAASISDKLDLILYERYEDIWLMAEALVFKQRDAAAMSKFLQAVKEAYPYYLWVGVTDARGRLIASTNPAVVGQDRSGREWFRLARDQRKILVLDAQSSEDSGDIMAVAFTAPILTSAGEFLGTVTTRVPVPLIEEFFKETTHALQIQRGSSSTVEYEFIRGDGGVIGDSILGQEGTVNLKELALPSALLLASAEPGFIEETHLRRHIPVVTGYSLTKGLGNFAGLHWGVLVRMDRQAILAPIHSLLLGLSGIGAFVFVPLIGFLMWTTRRLRRGEDRYRLLIQATAEGIYGMDLQGRCTFINSAGARMLQYESRDILGKPMHPLVHHRRPDGSAYPVEDCPIDRAFRSGRGCHREDEVFWRQDGTCFPASYSSTPIVDGGKIAGAVVSFTDITDRKRMEEQLRQSEKLAALGTLIDGVSHELNNPLFMISGHAQLAQELLLQGKTEHVMQNLQSIEHASRQMSVLVKRFVAIGRPGAGVTRACDLNAIMQETLELLKNDFVRHQIEVVWNSRKDLPKITVNPQEIAQVFLNLLTNATQALGRVECKRCVWVTSDLKVVNGADLLEIRITDNGPGISSGALSRIFEPFYTSRSEGTGAGLGLSFCHRVISSLHGTIEAGSEGGKGASFVIRIPTRQESRPFEGKAGISEIPLGERPPAYQD